MGGMEGGGERIGLLPMASPRASAEAQSSTRALSCSLSSSGSESRRHRDVYGCAAGALPSPSVGPRSRVQSYGLRDCTVLIGRRCGDWLQRSHAGPHARARLETAGSGLRLYCNNGFDRKDRLPIIACTGNVESRPTTAPESEKKAHCLARRRLSAFGRGALATGQEGLSCPSTGHVADCRSRSEALPRIAWICPAHSGRHAMACNNASDAARRCQQLAIRSTGNG
jgi:hypothetical protein